MGNQDFKTEKRSAFQKSIQALFTRLDLNGDGEVSRTELHQAAQRLGWHWPEAPLFAILDLLTVQGPIVMDRFVACLQSIHNDPMGPYGKVLLESPIFGAAGRVKPRDAHCDPIQHDKALSADAPAIDTSAHKQDHVIHRIAATSGAKVARAYQRTRAGLGTVRIATDTAAVLMIDPQRAFTHGVWMQSIGTGGAKDVVPLQMAFAHCKTLVQHYFGQVEMMFTRCPFPPTSYGWDEDLAQVLDHDQIYLIKPGNSVFYPPSNGFEAWVEQRMADGMRTLVMGGCTLNSCVRVSAIETQRYFGASGLQVVVGWRLSGARARNYLPSAQYNGISAVENAIEQMNDAGVNVVHSIAWQ